MTRITKKLLEERVELLEVLTNTNFVVGYWDGYSHVYNKLGGTMLITGTCKECKDAVDMFMYGYQVALSKSLS